MAIAYPTDDLELDGDAYLLTAAQYRGIWSTEV
jgi:hypothetical protein